MKIRLPLFVAATLASLVARAETVQVPAGGRAVPAGKGRVICGGLSEGWSMEADRKSVRPPSKITLTNWTIEVSVAADAASCARAATPVTFIATGAWPEIDPTSILFFPDEGRLEYKGQHLDQSQIVWQAGNRSGREACLAPTYVGKVSSCAIPIDRNLPLDTFFRWLPENGKDGSDVLTYDLQGHRVDPAWLVLRPAHIVLGEIFSVGETVDVSQGMGAIPLLHVGSVSTVDCGLAHCELGDTGIIVRNVPGQASQLVVTLRLGPRFAFAHGEKMDSTTSATFMLLRCPLTIVSGHPVRDADESQILVKMDPRCRSAARLRWSVGSDPAEVVRELHATDGDYVLLHTGQLAGGSITVTVARADSLAAVIGSVTTATIPAPRPQPTLELLGHGPIGFIPTNRDAVWSVGGVPHARLVPLDLPGVYSLRTERGRTIVRGEKNSGGYVSLRYAFRREGLPKEFADVNLAVLTESVQRPLHEASVPVPLAATDERKEALAEFICADAAGIPHALPPGRPVRIPYAARETCRIVIDQRRLRPEDGQQEIVLEVEVTKANGSKRSEASMNERMVLRPDGEAHSYFLKGVTDQFDQVTVRISHVGDETRYVVGTSSKQAPPSVQWSAIVEGGWARLYVSLTIPAGLYRMNDPVASLSLNFGVLGRLTWLDGHGKEGLLGLETGVLAASLIPQQDSNGNTPFPRTLDTLLGVGLRVEIGQGAAVGVHLWGAYEFRSEYPYSPLDGSAQRNATHWSLIFGPSISIGNVGTNL